MRRERGAAVVEAAAGIALSLLSLALHGVVARHAGALWRDEVNTAELATRSLGRLWAGLGFESYPILWPLLVGFWIRLGLGSDAGLRALGFGVGALGVGALWLAARLLGRGVPLLALALFGLSPLALVYGDSLRANGLAALLAVLALALVWQAAVRPSWRSLALAVLAGVLSVQCLYQNAALLAAACAAGVLVAWRRGGARRAAALLGVGALAAASLLVYVPTLVGMRATLGSSQTAAPARLLAEQLGAALASGSWLAGALWAAALALALGAAAWLQRPGASDARRADLALYGAAFALLAVPACLAVIASSGYYPLPWHYVALLAPLALGLDVVRSAALRRPAARVALAVALVLAGAQLATRSLERLRTRRTNVDALAALIAAQAGPGDLVVVSPWYVGTSFRRYYRGAAPWTTVPPLEDLSVERYDLFRAAMETPDPTAPLRARLEATLAAGGRVWFVLGLPIFDRAPEHLPPAPHPVSGYDGGPYILDYGRQVGHHAHRIARTLRREPVETDVPADSFERLALLWAEGVKARPAAAAGRDAHGLVTRLPGLPSPASGGGARQGRLRGEASRTR